MIDIMSLFIIIFSLNRLINFKRGDPKLSSKWYEEKLGFKLIYLEEEAAVMKIAEEYQTVICLVRTITIILV